MYLIQHTDFITGEKYNAPSNSSYSSIEYYYFSPYISFIYIFVISSISSTKWNAFLYSLHQTHNTASCWKVMHHFWAAECAGLPLKRKCCHFDEILITDCTESCHFDNFRCSQWWKFRQNDDISVSVSYTLVCKWRPGRWLKTKIPVLTSMAIPMIKIRRSCDRLVLSLSWESPYLNSLSFYWNRALPPFLYGFLTSCWGISHWEKWHFCKHISQWLRP